MELLSLVLALRPLPHSPEKLLPIWWGRAAHALVLNVARQYNPSLAESLHREPDGSSASAQDESASQTIRPFTVSSLMGRFVQDRLDAARTYTLRLTSFSGALTEILWKASQDGPLSPGRSLELDRLPFLIESVQPAAAPAPPSPPKAAELSQQADAATHAPSVYAASATYADLSAALLLSKEPAPRRLSLLFTSPATFKSGGKHVPLPLPELVFGSLLERWNAYAPILFPPEARRYAAECLAISRFDLNSRSTPIKSGGMRIGFVGQVSFTSVNYDRYWMSLMGVLAAFALFSGVGAGVTQGLGQCRQITE